MFDDKKQPDDMFADEKESMPAPSAAPSALLTPPPIARSQEVGPQASEAALLADGPLPHRFGFVKVLLVVIVVLGLVAGAAYAAYRIMVAQPADDGIVNSVSDDGVVADDKEGKSEGSTAVGTSNDAAEPEVKETIFDSDGDGLNNAEELEAGTLSNNPDTDSDGLGDREEVKVYGTDPRDSDTDGDTFLDGQEVAGGYNPNGEGKLFNVPN